MYSSLYPLSFVLSPNATEETAPSALRLRIRYLHTLITRPVPLLPFLLAAKRSQCSQPLVVFQVLRSLNHFSSPSLSYPNCLMMILGLCFHFCSYCRTVQANFSMKKKQHTKTKNLSSKQTKKTTETQKRRS